MKYFNLHHELDGHHPTKLESKVVQYSPKYSAPMRLLVRLMSITVQCVTPAQAEPDTKVFDYDPKQPLHLEVEA
jgi:hypothetical protein